jgi:hypothetical protein
MTVLTFPSNPTNGQRYAAPNGIQYVFDGVKWIVETTTSSSEAVSNSTQDRVAPMFVNGDNTGITFSYNATTNVMSAEVTSVNGDSLINGLKEFVLNSDGSITLPTLTTLDWDRRDLVGPTLQMGNDPTVSDAVITGPAPNLANPNAVRLIIQGQEGFELPQAGGAEGGDVYVWAGHGGEGSSYSGNGGDVKLRGGTGGLTGGYIRLESGDANATNGTGGFLDLNAGNSFNTGGQGGSVNIRAGEGTQQDGQVNITGITSITGITTINTDGGTWNFDNNGSLSSPNGYTLNRGQQTYFAAGAPPTVVYTSQDGTIGAIKAMIKVVDAKPNEPNGDYDVDTQVCEILVTVKRRFINGVSEPISTPVASVYGVTHTSTLPLATFTVNFVANMSVGPGMTRDVVQILAEPTAAATGNIWVTVAATEMTND